ncbi:hypothetical protein [Pseudoalteromonas piscicida]|uniref:hypothetical protein n=1 Tax=Pseudoalteromonas piscicida TaxID=43662 RepID=UPI0030A52F62
MEINFKFKGVILRYLFIMALAIVSNVSWATCSGVRCESVEVKRLYIKQDGEVLIGTYDDEKKLSCSPVVGVYLSLSVAEPGGKAQYSTLLAAQLAGKKVSIRIAEGSSRCKIEYLVLDKQ